MALIAKISASKTISVIAILAMLGAGGWWIVHTQTQSSARSLTASSTEMIQGQPMLPTKTITVGSTTVEVEVATTEKEHEAGLSGRTGLKDGTGMLFVFEQEGMYIFWMKDMLFPIDMVWIDADGVVVSVTANATPQSYNQDHPQTFRPISPALYVLELPAGYAAAHDIAEGSKVVL